MNAMSFVPHLPLNRATGCTLNNLLNVTTHQTYPQHCRRRTRPWHITITTTTPSCVTESPSPVPTSSSSQQPPLDSLLKSTSRRFVFFGGKGGVGKTSSAAAAAIAFADRQIPTLIISTDPAHSLGDALKIDLSDGVVKKVSDDLPLWAVETDTKEALEEVNDLLGGLEKQQQGDEEGEGWRGMAKKLGLSEFGEVLRTIPPGADELIALVKVLGSVDDMHIGNEQRILRVVVDTAPTGHTVRFLAFPDFLEKLFAQAVALREKIGAGTGVVGNVTKMFFGNRNVDVKGALDLAVENVKAYRQKMLDMSDLFRDPERTEFVVVSIATGLAVEESKRLIQRLWDDGVWVRHVLINQVLKEGDDHTLAEYMKQVRKGQAREISFATEQIADEYGLAVTVVPRFDSEVRGVYALDALANVAFRENRHPAYGRLFDEEARVMRGDESQFVFVGGKGGVGKTSTGGALGVRLATMGFKTLVLSTDPAHSLADALNMSLDGGMPIQVDLPGGELFAMEIDTEKAVRSFQNLTKEFVKEGNKGVGVEMARTLGLEEFAGLLDNAPPGIDELVALTQVMELVKFGDFDRVVVDTAPTGHTLRLLNFPEFLNEFFGKVIRLKKRLDSAIDTLRNVLGRKESADAVDKAAVGIGKLQENMKELRELVGNENRTQFVIVTAPTALAMVESERLVKALKMDGVRVRNLVINQVIPEGEARKYVGRIAEEQGKWIDELKDAGVEKGIEITQIPFFDREVRGVYGLRAMAEAMFSGNEEDKNQNR